MATADVTIMGAGVFGLSVAYACAQRGARVQVIDPHGVASGASGGIVGALAPHVPENWNDKKAFQLQSLLMAEQFWAGVSTLAGQDVGYVRSGRLQPLANERAVCLATDRAGSARELWRDHALWEVIPSLQMPWCPPSATGLVVRDTLSALIHPRRATQALARAVVALGGAITAKGQQQGKVVWATGWHGAKELKGNGIKGQAVLIDHDARGLPQLFIDTLHFVPHADGTVAIGSTSEREFDDPTTTDQLLDDLLTKAQTAFPVIRDAPILERWAGVRPRSHSRAPVLGYHPIRSSEYVANGGFKIGFGMAPLAGHVMADLVLEGCMNGIPEGFWPEPG